MSRPVFAGVLGKMSQDLGWADDANCRNMDVDLFFPPLGHNVHPFAREVCGSCDVWEKCLWYANETMTDDGVFAGMSPRQRQKWRMKNHVQMGMSKEAWEKTMQSNRLHTPPEDWRDGEQAV